MSPSDQTSHDHTPRRQYAVLVGLAVVYYASAALGLRLAYLHPSATPVWAPTGISLAALLIWGRSVWPAIFAAAFLVNLATEGNIATSAGIALGNTLEGVLGAYLVRRAVHGPHIFHDAGNVFRFVSLAGVLCTMVSATTGVTVLSLGGFAPWSAFGQIWTTWWLGDVAGALVVAPALILWAQDPRIRWPRSRAPEAISLILTFAIVGQLVFGGVVPSLGAPLPLEFLSIPLMLWAAVRFTPREAATAVLVLSGIAVHGTLLGLGPFARLGTNDSLVLAQSFTVVSAASTLLLAAVVAERGRATRQLRHLSESDGLTGLANYRKLRDVLARESQRSGRTNRSFALLLLDVNQLKSINDRYGHLTGNRAICRVAEAMKASCRAVDTPARFGGDEFAVVLPETTLGEALALAERIHRHVTASAEDPPLSISSGVASFPEDGTTPEALLEHADGVLYKMKHARPLESTEASP